MGFLDSLLPRRKPSRDAAPGGSPAVRAKRPPASRGSGRQKGRRRKGRGKDRLSAAAAPLHDRRRRLVGARDATLRDLGGLMLEMYKRNRFREELLLDKCEEVLAVEVEIAHIDQRLFQLAPANAAGMRPIGRCECGAPIHPGQNFCGICGRSFDTLTQSRTCTRCTTALRPGDQFCSNCGTEAPDLLEAITTPALPQRTGAIDAPAVAAAAVAQTVVMDAPPVDDAVAGAASAAEQTIQLPPVPPATPAGQPTTAPAAGTAQPPAMQHATAIDAALEAPTIFPAGEAQGAAFTAFPLTESLQPPATGGEAAPAGAPSAPAAKPAKGDGDPKADAKRRRREAKLRAKAKAKAAKAARKRGGR